MRLNTSGFWLNTDSNGFSFGNHKHLLKVHHEKADFVDVSASWVNVKRNPIKFLGYLLEAIL